MSASVASSRDAAASKAQWRDRFRAYRQGLSAASYRAHGTLIGTRALAHPALAGASTVHVYWPQLEQGEVDTRPLIQALRLRGVDLVMPVVTSYDPADPTLEHRRYDGPSALAANRWGIPEPTDTARVPPAALDAVLVPALGGDRRGNRIGHGAGYYDAFLAGLTVPRLLLAYAACVVPAVPAEPHDVPVTTIVTERDIITPDA
jgi:5-formyltetrahydrofolate cyclo-ligase